MAPLRGSAIAASACTSASAARSMLQIPLLPIKMGSRAQVCIAQSHQLMHRGCIISNARQ